MLTHTRSHTHTHHSVSANTCINSPTHTQGHRQRQTVTHTPSEAGGLTDMQRGNNHVYFVLPPLPPRSDILRGSAGWSRGQEGERESGWRERKPSEAKKRDRDSRV